MLDRASICVRAGRGGNGSMSFRREKYVPKGGPDGGDGAPGGDVVLVATRQLHDLGHFRHKHHFRAVDGGQGRGSNKRGADGPMLEVKVPVGTEVLDVDGAVLGDLVAEGQRLLVARGGEGGRGNVCFKSSTRQAPKFAEIGLDGEELWLTLSLKLLADIGLVGLPNAGKSSLLAALTRAHPKIAAYPFTTIEPNLGVLYLGDGTAVIADIPGLIEGASDGAGLGHRFLAHIERTALLMYVLDGGDGSAAWPAALATVRGELGAFRAELLERPAVVVVNKADLLDAESSAEAVEFLDGLSWPAAALLISAQSGDGLKDLVGALAGVMASARETQAAADAAAASAAAAVVLRPADGRLDSFTVDREGELFVVRGVQIERLFAKADLGNEDAVAYLQQLIERAGLNDALRKAGAKPGDTVVVGAQEFEFGVKTIVVKIGSSTVADDHLRLRRRLLAGLAADVAELVHGGRRRVVLVSSGAIACGQHVLGVTERPRLVPALQAASAVGQGRLFAHYERLFGDHELIAAQVLLTSDDFARRTSYVNARNTLRRLLAWGVVPVVNENDTTATDEIRFGDNDVLAAQVAIMLRASMLVLLTDQDGLYTSDPRRDPEARLVERVEHPRDLVALDVGGASQRGAGGMRGKVAAAVMASAADVRTVIANGARPGVLTAVVAGEQVGTMVAARPSGVSAFKLWLRYAKPLRGTLEIDAGAVRALASGGGSLLPVGVRAVHGGFAAGEAVAIVDPDGVEVARGLATMSARDLRRVRGLRSDELRALNPQLEDEIVHRDCLVLVGEEAE